MLPLSRTLAAAAIAVMAAAPAMANDPAARGTTPEAQRGYDIAARSDRTDLGFGDSEVELKMMLRNAAGAESIRELTITTLEKENETVGDKSLPLISRARIRYAPLVSLAIPDGRVMTTRSLPPSIRKLRQQVGK